LGAYKKALACDQISAFGGIIAANEMIDGEAALEMVNVFTEVIIAPDFSAEALEVFSQKKSLRILKTGGNPEPSERSMIFKPLSGGILVQDRDFGQISKSNLKVVTKRQPTLQELEDLTFAFLVAKHVKSNAIVYVKNGATVGVGAGQMSRVDSSRIAAKKAKEAADALGLAETLTLGSVVASDAFFPFSDGLLTAVEAGATSVIQPGGSIRDDEIIAVADDNDIAMIMTGLRHFRH
jgi:phosphoribosylaminoimidazolecarboxamide formyltransferase/IMP cyclohydrolase